MVDQTAEWRPDPYGVHEFRLFSADGKPTLLVMDGGKTSYDRSPTRPTRAPDPPPKLQSQPDPAPAPVAPPALGPQVTAVDACPVATVSTADTTDADTAVAREQPRVAVRGLVNFADDPSAQAFECRSQEALSHPLKIAYGVVFIALALSVLGLIYVHLHHTGAGHLTQAEGATTSSSAPRTTTTTLALPTALQTAPEAAATALVSSWSTGNRAAALTVATPAAVTTLFAAPYTSGLAIDRGCSTSFIPIVCTFGPPGGASPTDPIYEVMISQVDAGWYVSSVKIEN